MTSRVVPIPEELEDESTPSFSSFCNTLSSMLFTCSSNPSDYFPCCKIHSNSANAGEPLTVAEPVYTEKGGSDEKREINAPTFMPKTAPPPSKATIKCFSERDSDVIAGSHIVTVPQNHNNLEEIAKDTQGGTSHGIRPTVSLQQIALTKEQNDNIQVGLLRRNTDFSHVYSNYRYSTPMLQYPTPTNHETTTICDPNTIPFFFQQQNINNTINVCSEPIASIYKVRGPTYFQNGIKVPSQESLFALVQVESYVVNPTKQHPSKINDVMKSNSNNFLNQWKHLNPHPPFLLIVNWILPWGNLKSYFCQMITTYDGNTKLNSAHQLWNRFATQMTNVSVKTTLEFTPFLFYVIYLCFGLFHNFIPILITPFHRKNVAIA